MSRFMSAFLGLMLVSAVIGCGSESDDTAATPAAATDTAAADQGSGSAGGSESN